MPNDKAEIITIGDEILAGQIVNGNAAFIAAKLMDAGIPVGWMTTVGDDRDAILDAFKRAKSRARMVIITGGLGPTPDDLTKPCLVEFFDDKLVFQEHLFEQVKARFAGAGVEMPPVNRNQAEFPAHALEIDNPRGTATGIHYIQGDSHWFALPGVPHEMRYLTDSYVLPRLNEAGFGGHTRIRVFHTAGIGESMLLSRFSQFEEASQLVDIAFLPRDFGVDVKLTAYGENPDSINRKLQAAEELLLPDMELYCYGQGEMTLTQALGELAVSRNIMLAVAESCTGGLISKLFTDRPGSSAYFDRGVITYSNESKTELLGVPAALIEQHGAVSAEVAEAMAVGLLQRSRAAVTAAVTGIAGPDGGTDEKPVGLVYIAIADQDQVEVHRHKFIYARDLNRKRTAMTVIKRLYDRVKNLDSND